MLLLWLAVVIIFYFLSGSWLWKLIFYYYDYITVIQLILLYLDWSTEKNRILYHWIYHLIGKKIVSIHCLFLMLSLELKYTDS